MNRKDRNIFVQRDYPKPALANYTRQYVSSSRTSP